MPLALVLPSAASENIVSISDSNWSAGLIAHLKTSSSSPAFHQVCATPGATASVLPGPASVLRPPTFAPSVPETTSNVSHWLGWTCAAATLPPGSAWSSITTRSPPVSAAVSRNVMRSPVTGLTTVCPFSITSGLLARVDALTIARGRRRGNRAGLHLDVRISRLRWCGLRLARGRGPRDQAAGAGGERATEAGLFPRCLGRHVRRDRPRYASRRRAARRRGRAALPRRLRDRDLPARGSRRDPLRRGAHEIGGHRGRRLPVRPSGCSAPAGQPERDRARRGADRPERRKRAGARGPVSALAQQEAFAELVVGLEDEFVSPGQVGAALDLGDHSGRCLLDDPAGELAADDAQVVQRLPVREAALV